MSVANATLSQRLSGDASKDARCASSRCFHCGEALPIAPALATVDGAERTFCCTGCAAAARWIVDASLQDYYSLRQRDAAKIDPDDTDYRAWDRDDVLAGHTRAVDGGREITILTDGMRCAACAWLIDRALCRDDGVREVVANAVTGRIRIVWDPQRTRLSALLSRLATLGYRPALATGTARETAHRHERRRWLIRLGVAGLGAMQAMMFAEALYLDTARQMPIPTRDFFRWIAFLVSTPVVFYAGWPFIEGMWRELRGRRLGMDTLIASSTLLAYFASLIETLRGGVHVWYDAAVMFVFLLLAARMLEQRARSAASAQVDALARARPALAMRERADGSREQVPLEALRVGDIVRIAVGEAVPADGVLIDNMHIDSVHIDSVRVDGTLVDGTRVESTRTEGMPIDNAYSDGTVTIAQGSNAIAAFDESLLTGESRAALKSAGDAIYAGSLCRERPARLRVMRIGEDTRLSQLTRLVERAQAQRPALAQQADRIGAWFVAALSLIACAVYVWWRMHEPARAFEVALAVLVVSCPCALSLAVPTALTTVHGALAKLGVLALRPEALSALARADRIVFDKTGTLSDRTPRITAAEAFDGMSIARALAIAAALERDSGHPLAAAFASASLASAAHGGDIADVIADVITDIADLRSEPGYGIVGRIDHIHYRLGRAHWAAADDVRALADDDALWLGDGRRAFARFALDETLRADAADAVSDLRRLGLRVDICSGDAQARVVRLAAMLGIDAAAVRARQTPEDKLAYAHARQAAGEVVAMVGDGLNDAPVLAGANVSLALADGAALAQRAADFVIVGDALRRIPQAVALARRSERIVRENIAWAIGYNLLALPLAASGVLTPWMAAVGMALSSLLVTLNALRLARVPAMPDAQHNVDGQGICSDKIRSHNIHSARLENTHQKITHQNSVHQKSALDQAAFGEAAP
jgi:Cu2+-exporting ATPase